ncbi:hypothetical protein HCJ93_18095 [Streptomyces sp. SBST2-5]|uniref:Secreted protein n=1 Tax=Streptomyces composti TaxID=2720025 RepID=A0ABX1ABB3_9ACTN|nr:hypothetical protein [Streptomyces composti]NJP51924.1 hypothetical protein [Streptomyces composti]
MSGPAPAGGRRPALLLLRSLVLLLALFLQGTHPYPALADSVPAVAGGGCAGGSESTSAGLDPQDTAQRPITRAARPHPTAPRPEPFPPLAAHRLPFTLLRPAPAHRPPRPPDALRSVVLRC